ncbi:MAG TPA: LON peptidase substrate-binding domain-containing protein [Candidatus Dormibacteraeota bacterium]|nr:LON peptidase substrate-binding domain-containing protein [Candidatus Dormibacteraeota bacterium]
MSVRLPLFPLNTVLFPHMPAGLHIFEERYREMIRDCQEQGTSFGVVAIREGIEVGHSAFPFDVGTLAQIHEIETLDDGRFNLVVAGASRFRVDSLSLNRSYLVGTIQYLEDTRGDEAAIPELARRTGSAFATYSAALRNLADDADEPAEAADLPDDPELLSYLVAASLNVEVNRRQELLEEDSVSGRLRRCLSALRRETVFLDQMLARRDHHIVPVSLN